MFTSIVYAGILLVLLPFAGAVESSKLLTSQPHLSHTSAAPQPHLLFRREQRTPQPLTEQKEHPQSSLSAVLAADGEFPSQRMTSVTDGLAGGPLLVVERTPQEQVIKQGVRIYKSQANENRRLDRAVTAFKVSRPEDSTLDVEALGALTLSRCGRKDILGKSNSGEDNPCHSVCHRGGCYPWEDDSTPGYGGRTSMITPTFYSKIHVPGVPDACDCEWKSKSCNARQHHCTLVLPACSCQVTEGKHVEMIVAADAGDGIKTPDHWIMELEDKGFLAIYDKAGKAGKQKAVNPMTMTPRFPANHDPDDDSEKDDYPSDYSHLVSTVIPSGDKDSIALIQGKFTMRLFINHTDPHRGKHGAACDPLVNAVVLLSEGMPTTWSTLKSAVKKRKEFGFKLSENCVDLGDAPECTFVVADIAKLSQKYSEPYVTLAVSAARTCVRQDEDFWSPVEAELSAKSYITSS